MLLSGVVPQGRRGRRECRGQSHKLTAQQRSASA